MGENSVENKSSKYLMTDIKINLSPSFTQRAYSLKEEFSSKSLDEKLRAGSGKTLHLEALEVLSDECQKLIDKRINNLLENPEELGKKIANDALKKASAEMKKQRKEIQNNFESQMREEVLKAETEERENLSGKVKNEKMCGEKRLLSALDEAQKHFRDHLKMEIEHIQEEQKSIWEEKFSKIKKEFEDKMRDISEAAARNKERRITQMREQYQKETMEFLRQLRAEEQQRLNCRIYKQKQDQDSDINKLELKIDKLEKEMQKLMSCLKETLKRKAEIEAEITKIKNLLTQFVKLASKTEKDPNYKAKIGEMLKRANIDC
ncbi:cingulin-like isoform X1 [Centruroides sculpturatus]|uniref:cingulin-like isoform X1 n=1 Tax=Centruroides sculpturatus TaxID=218467 RepID=UPI000C6DBBD7|nr:cingulin-like isoform X1 [Centruroides sculpturatus]XP_023238867.1 cingulin-like isoform X1 [Centruroides sculpturatus]